MRSSVGQPGQVAGQAHGATLGHARTPSVPEGLEPGALLLGKYRVDRILGRGGMGCVAAVRNEDLGELFAMKLLLPEIAGRPGAVERFVHEARAAARLRTPHVVRVYDVGRLDDGAPYMLMEYLEGKDLGALLEDRGVLTPGEVVDYMLEALDAMCEAHALGIIHRDLKPANLFITPGRERPLLKVLDFGISKDLDARAQSMTQSGGLMGSPYYMSPEHMRSAKRVDARTDLWSLGVIMFELLSGKLPFDGDTTTEVCSAVLEAPLPSLAALAPTTPSALVEVVERCLRRSADERYANGHELASALRRVRDDLGDAPRSPHAATRAFDGPRVWAADVPTLPPQGDGGAPVAESAPAARRAPSLEPWHASLSPAPRRSRWWPFGIALLALGGSVTAWAEMRAPDAPSSAAARGAASTEAPIARVTARAPDAAPQARPEPVTSASVSADASAIPATSAAASSAGRASARPAVKPQPPGTPNKVTAAPTIETAPILKRPKF